LGVVFKKIGRYFCSRETVKKFKQYGARGEKKHASVLPLVTFSSSEEVERNDVCGMERVKGQIECRGGPVLGTPNER